MAISAWGEKILKPKLKTQGSTESFLLDLPVGNDSWAELQLPCQFVIDHFVVLDGQLIVSNSYGRSYALQLAPQHGLRKEEGRLVVCGDMLLILSFSEFHRPDMSTEPAIWVDLTRRTWASGHSL